MLVILQFYFSIINTKKLSRVIFVRMGRNNLTKQKNKIHTIFCITKHK